MLLLVKLRAFIGSLGSCAVPIAVNYKEAHAGSGVAEYRAHVYVSRHARVSHQPGPAPEEELDPTMASKKSKTTKKAKKGKR